MVGLRYERGDTGAPHPKEIASEYRHRRRLARQEARALAHVIEILDDLALAEVKATTQDVIAQQIPIVAGWVDQIRRSDEPESLLAEVSREFAGSLHHRFAVNIEDNRLKDAVARCLRDPEVRRGSAGSGGSGFLERFRAFVRMQKGPRQAAARIVGLVAEGLSDRSMFQIAAGIKAEGSIAPPILEQTDALADLISGDKFPDDYQQLKDYFLEALDFVKNDVVPMDSDKPLNL